MEAKCQNVHYTTKHNGCNTVSHYAMCKTSSVTNELTVKPTMINHDLFLDLLFHQINIKFALKM